MDTIETILKREFPELKVDIPSFPGTSNIEQDELTKALQYIREKKLFQDSEKLLKGYNPMRSSVTYPIIFPEQKRELSFRVEWIQGPMIYLGRIESKNHVGDSVLQVRMYGMNIR